jgi:hypothetical protein
MVPPLVLDSIRRRGVWRARATAVVIGCLSLAYWARVSHGGLPALSYDSFRYLGGAQSILTRGAYLDLDGTPQHAWPPGTSFVYAAASRLSGRPAEELVPAVNLIALLAALFVFWQMLEIAKVRSWIAVIAFSAFALNGVFLSGTAKLWSDPIALPLLLAMLFCLMTGRLVAANVLAAVAVTVRFAMVATLPVLVIAAFLTRRFRILPFITGAAMLFFLLAMRGKGGTIQPIQLRGNWDAFAALAAQMVPSTFVVLAATIVIPAVVARRALPVVIALTWILSYAAFLMVAQALATPSFTMDLRILFPLYPAMLLAAAVAAESANHRAVTMFIALILGIASLRAAHYVLGSLRDQPAAQHCITREQLVAEIRRVGMHATSVATNAQGLVWFALRRPVYDLGRGPAPRDATILWVDPATACAFAVDSPSVPRQGHIIDAVGGR